MATAGELQIIIQSVDNASAQLRQVGQEVARLEQSMNQANRGAASFGQSLLTGAAGGAAFAALTRIIDTLGGSLGFLTRQAQEAFRDNSSLERAAATLRVFTGSAQEAQRVLTELRREADITPFNTQEMIEAGAALSATAKSANQDLLALVRTAEILGARNREQGLQGAAIALREAFEGNLQSLQERFGVTTAAIQRFRSEGLSTFQAVTAAMREMGLTSELVEQLGRTFEGRQSTVTSFFQELRQRLGENLFQRVGEAFGHMVALIERYGDQLRRLASEVGASIGGFLSGIVQILEPTIRQLLNLLAPGFGDAWADEFAKPIAPLERLTQVTGDQAAAMQRLQEAFTLGDAGRAFEQARGNAEALRAVLAQTEAPVGVLNRALGQIGVQAAEAQLEATRIRSAYQAQLDPLERQLRLLQQSADVQRIQNALASNRAAVERLRLTRELVTLEQAAGRATDPNAPDLTPRQRAIALALEERRLQLEGLDAEEQRRPLLQGIQDQINRIEEAQRQALEPTEARLRLLADERDVLQVQVQRWQNLRAEIDAAAKTAQTSKLGPGQLDEPGFEQRADEFRQKGEEFATRLLAGFRTHLDANGGDIWKAIGASFNQWWEGGGREEMVKLGRQVGGAIAQGIADLLGEFVKQTLFPAGLPQAGGGFNPGAALPPGVSAGGSFNPGASLPRVGGSFDPSAIFGRGGDTNVTVNASATGTGGGPSEEEVRRLAAEAAAALADSLAQAEAGTDPGANRLLPGNTR